MIRLTSWSLVLVLVTALAGCSRVPVRVAPTEDGVTVDVSTLGEYPTSVRRLRISKADQSEVVWEVVAKDRAPQLWQIPLRVGQNSTEVTTTGSGRFRLVTPSGQPSFEMHSGEEYLVEVWGKRSLLPRVVRFSLDGDA